MRLYLKTSAPMNAAPANTAKMQDQSPTFSHRFHHDAFFGFPPVDAMRFEDSTLMLISGRLRWPLTEKIYTGITEVKPLRERRSSELELSSDSSAPETGHSPRAMPESG